MAIYHLSATVVSRARGQRIVALAAARSGTRLRDARYGITHNHERKQGIAHAEIIAPAGAPAWTHDREALWNRVEAGERRWDSQLARAIEVGLPIELSHEQGVALMREFLVHEFVAQGMIADFSVRRSDPNNPHAHVLLTLRRATTSGFGPKVRDWNRKSNLMEWRAAWAERTNRHLARAGHDVRIDHRTLEAQQIELTPGRKTGLGRPLPTQRLPRHWVERITEGERIARQNGEAILEDPTVAVRAITLQRSTFSYQELAQFVEPRTADAAQLDAVLLAIMNSGELVPLDSSSGGQGRFTARHLLEARKSLAKRASVMAMRRSPGPTPPPLNLPASVQLLSAAERGAFDYLTASGDFKALAVSASDAAGRLLSTAIETWQAQGFRVLGIEPRTLASREHGWLTGADPLTPNDVLVVAGFGTIGVQQLERILVLIDKARAKVVLVCEEEQLETITEIPRSLLWPRGQETDP